MNTLGIQNVREVARRLSQSVAVLLMLLVTQFALAVTPTAAPAPTPASAAAFPASGAAAAPVPVSAPVPVPVPTKLVVGTLAGGWAPFEDAADGRLTGLSADYLRALVGPAVVIEARTFPDMPQLLAAVAAGKVDLLMSVARTPEREHSLSFTAPYFRASTSVVVKADDNAVKGPQQLANARLAIERGFALERGLRERFPRAQIVSFCRHRLGVACRRTGRRRRLSGLHARGSIRAHEGGISGFARRLRG
jgi:two-component system sensor histidine kinase EvgS